MPNKKKAPESQTVKTKTKVSASTQSATELRSAESQLDTLLTRYVPAKLKLVATVRKLLRKRLPSAHEIVYEYANQGAVVISFSPSEHGYEGVLAIRGDADGVKLYFTQGKNLSDQAKQLNGSANARWIPLETASTLALPEVASLIDEAIARHRVPFAKTGRGLVTIRSSSGK